MRKALLAAAAAIVLPASAFAADLPGPQLNFLGPQPLTTSADVQAQAHELTGKGATPQRPTAPATPATVQTPPPPQSVAASSGAPGCGANGDITQLLSPACLQSLRSMQPPGGIGAPMPPPAPSPQFVQCTVAIFAEVNETGGSRSGGMSSFTVPSLERCIEAGARLSYGVPGLSNITAIDPSYGVVAVACKRPGPDGHTITCVPQPTTQGADSEPANDAAASQVPANATAPIVQVGPTPATSAPTKAPAHPTPHPVPKSSAPAHPTPSRPQPPADGT